MDDRASAPPTGEALEAALRAARILADTRNYAAAIEQTKRALELDPECVRAHYLLGLYLYLSGKRPQALEPCRSAIALAPQDAVAHRVYGVILGAWPADRRRGLDHLRTAVSLAPEDGLNHYFLGRGLAGLGRRREATTCFDAACARAPNDPTILAGYGEFMLAIGKLATARDYTDRALMRAPDDHQVLAVAAQVALRQGQVARARDLALAALAVHATFGPAMEVLVEANMRRNPFLALWSRWRGWCLGRPRRAVLGFFGLWALCNGAILICAALDPALSTMPVFGFGGLLVLLWVAPRLFRRRVKRELRDVALSRKF